MSEKQITQRKRQSNKAAQRLIDENVAALEKSRKENRGAVEDTSDDSVFKSNTKRFKNNIRPSESSIKANSMKRSKPDIDPVSFAREEIESVMLADEIYRDPVFSDTLDFALASNDVLMFANFFAAGRGAMTGGISVRSFTYDSLAAQLGITRTGVKGSLGRLVQFDMIKLEEVAIKGKAIGYRPILTDLALRNCCDEYLQRREQYADKNQD